MSHSALNAPCAVGLDGPLCVNDGCPNEVPDAELSEHERLTRALDVAQDEIERLISEKEALRERIQAVLTELDRADREYEKSRKACRGSVWSPQPVVFTPDIRALIGGGS